MLSTLLNTNEIKNSAGVKVDFQRLSTRDRSAVYAQINEPLSLPNRLTVSHLESGTGLKKRRRSVIRFDKTVISTVDSLTPVVISGYTVLDAPVGALLASTELLNVLAQLQSFLSTTGAATTVLFDCTGNGANALATGGL